MTKVNESKPVVDATSNVPLYPDGLAPDIVKASPVVRPWSPDPPADRADEAVTVPLAPLKDSEDRVTLWATLPSETHCPSLYSQGPQG